MANLAQTGEASVVSLWRYPVKSMMGEELHAVEITERGLLGDRAYALIDQTDGKIVSAKNPKKWPGMFSFRATLTGPAVQITMGDGTILTGDRAELNRRLSSALGREVSIETTPPQSPTLEEYWPDIENLAHRDEVTDEGIPSGGFFDGAFVHLLTTATIDALRKAYPQGRFEARRFRPNIVVAPAEGEEGFIENGWVGHTLAIGEQVRLSITRPCPRCVMTTLPQGDLPEDPGILRAAAEQNQAQVGVYAGVLQGGTIRRGDTVRVVD